MPAAEIARSFGIPATTLGRHFAAGHAKPTARTEPTEPVEIPDLPAELSADVPADHPLAETLMGRAEVYARVMESFRRASGARDTGVQAALLPGLARLLKDQQDAIAKVEAPKSADERLMDHPDFLETALAITAALEPFPEAREAVREVLERLAG